MGIIRNPEVKRLYKLLGLLLAVFLCLAFLFSQWKAYRLRVGIADNISAAVGILQRGFPKQKQRLWSRLEGWIKKAFKLDKPY